MNTHPTANETLPRVYRYAKCRILGFVVVLCALVASAGAAEHQVQWGQASYQVAENGGSLSAALVRAPAQGPAVTVAWETVAVSAVAGQDYVAFSGTTIIPAGNTSQVPVTIQINDNQTYAGNRTLKLRITGATGNWNPQVVTPSEALVTIVEDELPPVPVAAITADLAAGTYTGSQSVTLSTATDQATIHYTLDGSVPTTASPVAAGPIELPGSVRLRAVAVRTGWINSPLFSANYALRVPMPIFEQAPGTYFAELTVKAGIHTSGAQIHFTTDGTVPTAASPLWPASGVVVDRTTRLRLRAYRDGWLASSVLSGTYTLRASPVIVTLPGGTYSSEQQVALVTSTPAGVIHYTLDGSVPTVESPVATGLIPVTQSTVLRAVATREGWSNSAVLRASYTLRVPAPAALTPSAGTYSQELVVSTSVDNAEAVLRYTVDGSAPTAFSPVLPAAGLPLAASATVRVIATREGWSNSPVVSARYTLRVTAPEPLNPIAGTYYQEPLVFSTVADAQATVRYTVDGTTPTAASEPLPAEGLLLTSSATVRVVATRPGWSNSPVVSARYTLRVTTPQPSLAAGTYDGEQWVSLGTATAGAVIHYTVDGSAPTVASPQATGPILLAGNTTLRSLAVRPGWTNSAALRAVYALRVPAPQLTPAGGSFVALPLVTATSTDAAAVIRFTQGAAVPKSNSPIFPLAGLQLTVPTTLNFVATRTGWTMSLPVSASYAYNQAPVVQPLTITGDEDTLLVGEPIAADPEGAALTWSIQAPPSHGAVVALDATTGVFTYLGNQDWYGSDTFMLDVSDGMATVAVVVTVHVAAVDDAAVITVPASGSAPCDADLVLTGFTVADIDSPTVALTLTVDAGTLSLPLLATSGAVVVDGAAGTGFITIGGMAEAVTAALASVVWRAPATSGSHALVVAGNGGTASVTLNAAPPVAPIDVAALAVTNWDAPAHGSQVLPSTAQFWNLAVAATGRYHLWVGSGAGSWVVELDSVVVGGLHLAQGAEFSCRDGAGTVLTLDLAEGQRRLLVRGDNPPAQFLLVAETPAAAYHDQPLVAGPGSVTVIDALSYDEVGVRDGTAWLPTTLAGTPGVSAQPDVGQFRGHYAGHSLSYSVWFTAPGTYRIYARGMGPGTGDSLHIAVNGHPAVAGLGFGWPASETRPIWGNSTVTNAAATIVIASAGMHSIDVTFREDGTAFQQLAIAGLSDWLPADLLLPLAQRHGISVPDAEGRVVVDATIATQVLPGLYSHAWEVTDHGLRALPDIGFSRVPGEWTRSPVAWWHVRLEAGRNNVFVHGAAPDFAGDSVYVALASLPQLSGGIGLPVSASLAPAWTGVTLTGGLAVIDVPAAGDYAIGLWMREDGASVRHILIQPEGQPIPTGSIPASPVVPVGPLENG